MWGWFSGGVLIMLRFSEHTDSSWERAPRCEEAIGARHMTLRHHWRLQLTPEGLTSWPCYAINSFNLGSISVNVTSIESSFQALYFWIIEISLTGLILEMGEEGHKKTEHSNLRSLMRLLQRCFQIRKIRTVALVDSFFVMPQLHVKHIARGGPTLNCPCLPHTLYNVPNIG